MADDVMIRMLANGAREERLPCGEDVMSFLSRAIDGQIPRSSDGVFTDVAIGAFAKHLSGMHLIAGEGQKMEMEKLLESLISRSGERTPL